jgi:hypothetical protein
MKVFCLWCHKLIDVYAHIRFDGVYYSVCQTCLNSQNEGYKEVTNEKEEKEKED